MENNFLGCTVRIAAGFSFSFISVSAEKLLKSHNLLFHEANVTYGTTPNRLMRYGFSKACQFADFDSTLST